MIDLHCHILPGLDDGPELLEEAVGMCRTAALDGVKCIVATPHFKPGTFDISGPRILQAIGDLTAAVQNIGLDIRILPGAEVAVSPEIFDAVKPGEWLTLNQGSYFLAEFSALSVPVGWDAFLLSFLNNGLTPIIAHPERNAWFIRHIEALSAAVQRGIRLQITSMSLTGDFGIEARDFCIQLLRRNLVHIMASDAHSANFRPPRLSEALRLAADVVGKQRSEALVIANPLAVINGRPIPDMGPVERAFPLVAAKRKNWFKRLWNFSFVNIS